LTPDWGVEASARCKGLKLTIGRQVCRAIFWTNLMTNFFRTSTAFCTKRDPADLVDQINSILGHAAASNAAWLGARLDGPTAAHIGAVDIGDLTDEAFDRPRARAEMMGEDAAAGLAQDPSAQATVSQYQAWVNARRQ
jgi:hypothetical protein